MEGLRPDRDELDQFKHRSARTVKKTSASAPKVPVVRSKPPVGLWFFVVILIAVCGFLGFGLWQQQDALTQLRKQINNTEGFVGQSKLLMARLEGELSETGAELEQSGSAVEKKLDFLDSEMRKLWGVSNDRNKKAIQANEAAVAGLESRIVAVLADQKKLAKKLESVASSNEKLLSDLQSQLSAMEKRIALAASEASITREATTEELANLRQRLDKIEAAGSKSADNAKAIESINASRRQLNERVVDLERQLNQLKLQQQGAGPAPLVQ